MKPATPTTTAERIGQRLGRMWRGCVRQEARAIQGLANKGVPIGLARLLSWIVKLGVLGLLLYSVVWLALALVFVAIAAWLARHSDLDDEKQPELRDGHSGVGLYDKDDLRIDMGDPDKP